MNPGVIPWYFTNEYYVLANYPLKRALIIRNQLPPSNSITPPDIIGKSPHYPEMKQKDKP